MAPARDASMLIFAVAEAPKLAAVGGTAGSSLPDNLPPGAGPICSQDVEHHYDDEYGQLKDLIMYKNGSEQHIAAAEGYGKFVQLLIDHCADVNSRARPGPSWAGPGLIYGGPARYPTRPGPTI
ncbi:hypothetical protein EJ110_NYTH37973 [Nymphaea thermarum]|nr:hypothetical protein EJ110_NYTH37973 [Nymphaea thermarum]